MRSMLISEFADPLTIHVRVWENNRNSQPVVDELLKHFASQPAAKIEELRRQIRFSENQTISAKTGANRVGDVAERPDGDP